MNRDRIGLLIPYAVMIAVVALLVVGAARRQAPWSAAEVFRDPVCGMDVGAGIDASYQGDAYTFCTQNCRELFLAGPDAFIQASCIVCAADGTATPIDGGSSYAATWQGETYLLCSDAHRNAFQGDPAGYFLHTMWGIPGWLYYSSIALLLVLSFGIIEWRSKHRSVASPRVDLLRTRWIFTLVTHPATRFVARSIVVAAFLLIVAAGLFGLQLPSKNVAPILTWTLWWGGLVWLVAYLGKAWCYVCPWDALADWAEGMRLWGRKQTGLSLGLRWPRFARNIWPATFFFVGLTWLELGFGVTLNPRATALLALLMLGLAFVSAFVFDRRSFCRYGCLVGRVSGLYALFAPIEVRARDLNVCRSCTTGSCFKGNGKGEACPTSQYLGTMDQNTYCISCMECVKSCEHQNVALNLRPWGEDLIGHHRARADEAYLALLMLALTAFHGLTMTGVWGRLVDGIGNALGVGETAAFSLGMLLVTVAPVAIYAALVALSRWVATDQASGSASGSADGPAMVTANVTVGYREYFIRYAYALLPIALFYHLAHNSEHLLMEGQRVASLASDPLGRGWNLLGTAGWTLPPLADLPTLWLLQVGCVLVGHIYSLWAARRAAETIFPSQSGVFRSQLPMLLAMILFSVMSLWLLKQPMEMRTSAM